MPGQNRIARHQNNSNKSLKRRQKIPFQKKPKKNNINLPQAVKKQNFLRREFSRNVLDIKSLRPIRSVSTGIDYQYTFKIGGKVHKVTLDMKFSFGMLGEHTISARIGANRKLINDANWVMAVNKKGNLELFKMSDLAEYINKNWGSINKNKMIHKVGYSIVPINLENFYAASGISPIVFSGDSYSIRSMLNSIKTYYTPLKSSPIKNYSPIQKIKRTSTRIKFAGKKTDLRREHKTKGAVVRTHLARNN
jgi:hypothetical protein